MTDTQCRFANAEAVFIFISDAMGAIAGFLTTSGTVSTNALSCVKHRVGSALTLLSRSDFT